MPIIVVGIIVLALIVAFVVWLWPIFVTLLAVFLITVLTLFILKRRYFSSQEFLRVKADIAEVVGEHNQISEYVREIREGRRFSVGKSSSGVNAHLAESVNTTIS
jgi:Flp pilus assembly protein TadB